MPHGDRLAVSRRERRLYQLRSRPGHLVFSPGAEAHPGKTGARSYFGIRRREPPGTAGFHRQFSVGVSGNRGAGGSATQALPVPGSALSRASAQDWPQHHHRGKITVLHLPRSAGCVCQRSEIRAPQKEGFRAGRGISMERLLNVTTVLSILLVAMVLFSVRRSHIRVEYSVSWLAAAVILLVLSRSSTALIWISRQLGLADPPLALLLLVFCVFVIVIYRLSVVISDLKDANIAMAQRLAIVEFQLQNRDDDWKD